MMFARSVSKFPISESCPLTVLNFEKISSTSQTSFHKAHQRTFSSRNCLNQYFESTQHHLNRGNLSGDMFVLRNTQIQ